MTNSHLNVPTLAEDLLLLLFQPESGTIAGENTLFYPLAGALLTDLALQKMVTTTTSRVGTVIVEPVAGQAPSDVIYRSTWDYISAKPRGIQTVLAAIGPTLRQPLLDRLIARGDIREEKKKALRVFETTALRDGGNGRRSVLLDSVRSALVEGTEPTPPHRRPGRLAVEKRISAPIRPKHSLDFRRHRSRRGTRARQLGCDGCWRSSDSHRHRNCGQQRHRRHFGAPAELMEKPPSYQFTMSAAMSAVLRRPR